MSDSTTILADDFLNGTNWTATSTKASVRNDHSADLTSDDATWILTASFVIFTMQTGFGLLESGAVTKKNEVNIMMKNAADVVLGGIGYWMYGYGLQYGDGPGTNPFCGVGKFLLDADPAKMGTVFTTFIFQLSFATTATTIVSGAMAERTDFNAYCVFSFLNTITYCIPAGWLWGDHGFLRKLGVLDFAGSSGVHLLGGASALVACVLLKPRLKRYDNGNASSQMGNPTNAMIGTFTLWWGWLVFNCGSTFGISNNKWHYAGRAAVTTVNASLGGGLVGIFYSHYFNRMFLVSDIMNTILAALVAVTAGSGYYTAVDSVIVGIIGAIIVCPVPGLLDKAKIDDPVGAVAVHAVGGVWGMVAVGLFAKDDRLLDMTQGRRGLLRGGGFYLLGVQILACVCITIWSMSTTFIILKAINFILPIRMPMEEEIMGADFIEHDIHHEGYDYEAMMKGIEKEYGIDMEEHRRQRHQITSRVEFDEYLIENYLIKVQPTSDFDSNTQIVLRSRPLSSRVGDRRKKSKIHDDSCALQ